MRCPACDHENIPGEDLCENCGLDLAGLDVKAWGVDPEDPLLAAPLASLPLKEPLVLPPSATVTKAIDLMKHRHEGCVFIEDGQGRVLGVLGGARTGPWAGVSRRGDDPTSRGAPKGRSPSLGPPPDGSRWASASPRA